MDACVDAFSTVLKASDQDVAVAEQACSGLETAFFEKPARQLQGTDGLIGTPPVDVLFLFICTVLVFVMQAGFAMLCVGSIRVKNAQNILLKNVIDGCVAGIAMYFVGFGIAYGSPIDEEGNAIGGNVFIGSGDWGLENTGHLGKWHRWFFNWGFAAAAATIVSGSVAERCKFEAYVLYSFFITGFLYPVVAHWAWSPHGWLCAWGPYRLFDVGVVDWAGCIALHYVGGLVGFVAAAVMGPRKGRFDEDGKLVETNRFKPHNTPLVVLGTFFLWIGWFGFNPGSTIVIDGLWAMEVVMRCATTTTMAASAAGLTSVFFVKWRTGVYELVGLCNGILAGLVAITAGCSVVAPWAACLIGAGGAILFNISESFILKTLKVDDPLSASAMHGVVGLYGGIMPCLFAREVHMVQAYGWPEGPISKGLFYGGDGRMLPGTLVGIIAVTAWVGGVGFLFFYALHKLNMLRVPEEEEEHGIDIMKHGGLAYNTVPSDLAQKTRNTRVLPADDAA